jgi:hypothetical protein
LSLAWDFTKHKKGVDGIHLVDHIPQNRVSYPHSAVNMGYNVCTTKSYKEERNIVQNRTDNCKQIRKLHSRLVEELRILKEDLREEEFEGVANPIVTANIIKSLQEALNTVTYELQKCPDEES